MKNSTEEVIDFFKSNEIPFFYIGGCSVNNLFGVEKFVKHFFYVTSMDWFNRSLPNAFSIKEYDSPFNTIAFNSNELLKNETIINKIKSHLNPKVIFLMYDKETEELVSKHNFQMFNINYPLFSFLGNKTKMTSIIEKLKIPTIPYIISSIKSYQHLRDITARLGEYLVIQQGLSDSGIGTYFISDENDFNKYKEYLINSEPLKIMKRIQCSQFCIDAAATRYGTVVGPLQMELIGYPELTPYLGGWCGNQICKDLIEKSQHQKVLEYTKKLGDYLYQNHNFKGAFGIDYLLDHETNVIYFGELNPRICGSSCLTNQIYPSKNFPLFLFHLMEFLDLDFKVDIDEINRFYLESENLPEVSLLIVKGLHQSKEKSKLKTGIWKMENNKIYYDRFNYLIEDLKNPLKEAVILSTPTLFTKGDAFARLLFKEPVMIKGKLTQKAQNWIRCVREQK